MYMARALMACYRIANKKYLWPVFPIKAIIKYKQIKKDYMS